MKALIKEKEEKIEQDKENLETETKASTQLKYVLPKYQDKVRKLEDYLMSKKDDVEVIRKKHKSTFLELQKVSRENLENLVKYIFPIRQIVEGQDTEGIIAEASRTVLVRGKWLTTAPDDGNYMIVSPYLPADGDYNIYNDWVLTNRGETSLPSSASHDSLISNSAYRICAALTYTAQLVETVASYLGQKLPYKLSYCDFCRIDLPERRFNVKVARLNANILYLCYTQNMDLKTMDPTRTLENLHRLLIAGGAPELGRRGAVERENCLSDEEDQKLAQQLRPTGLDWETDDEGSEESQLAHEWEAIPQPTVLEMMPQATMSPQPNFVSSFTSMFRWGK